MANPIIQHVTSLKHILQYLIGTKSYGIEYFNSHGDKSSENHLFHSFFDGFANIIYANADSYKSTLSMSSSQQGER